jgi:hypothetical protein
MDAPTSREAYETALDRLEEARKLNEEARATARRAAAHLEASEKELAAHEAHPGIPAYIHINLAPERSACRIGASCRVHWPRPGDPWHGWAPPPTADELGEAYGDEF